MGSHKFRSAPLLPHGYLRCNNSEQIGSEGSVVGVDINEEMLNIAKSKALLLNSTPPRLGILTRRYVSYPGYD